MDNANQSSLFLVYTEQNPEQQRHTRLDQIQAHAVVATKNEIRRSMEKSAEALATWPSAQGRSLGIDFIYDCIQQVNQSISSKNTLMLVNTLEKQLTQLWSSHPEEKRRELVSELRRWLVHNDSNFPEITYFRAVYANAFIAEISKTEFTLAKFNELKTRSSFEIKAMWLIFAQNPVVAVPETTENLDKKALLKLRAQKEMGYLLACPNNLFSLLAQLDICQGVREVSQDVRDYCALLESSLIQEAPNLKYDAELAKNELIGRVLSRALPLWDTNDRDAEFEFFLPALLEMQNNSALLNETLSLYVQYLPTSLPTLEQLLKSLEQSGVAVPALIQQQSKEYRDALVQVYDGIKIKEAHAEIFAPIVPQDYKVPRSGVNQAKKI